jgi:hypothetical protein
LRRSIMKQPTKYSFNYNEFDRELRKIVDDSNGTYKITWNYLIVGFICLYLEIFSYILYNLHIVTLGNIIGDLYMLLAIICCIIAIVRSYFNYIEYHDKLKELAKKIIRSN